MTDVEREQIDKEAQNIIQRCRDNLNTVKKTGNIIQAVTRENLSLRFPTRFDINRTAQPQKMARGLKFLAQEVEELYYLWSKNKGADQLSRYGTADLRLCFCICKKVGF